MRLPTEEDLNEAIEVIRTANRPVRGTSILQRRLVWGYQFASQVLVELSRRQLVTFNAEEGYKVKS